MVKQVSYWIDTAPVGVDYTASTLPDKVDVAIVGGGFTGLSSAIHLRRKGASVALLERHKLGWGASGRNGGFCTPGITISLLSAIRRFGFDVAARMYLAYDAAIDTVERLVLDEGIDCDWGRSGKMSLAYRPAHYESFARTHEILATRLGHETTLVPKDRLRTEIGTDYYHGGLVDPRGAGLHVAKFARGLARVAEREGAGLHEAADVTGLTRTAGGFEVRTRRGTVRATNVVVATDGYTGRATPFFQRRIAPVGSFIIVTEPLSPELLRELNPNRRVFADSKNLVFYFRLTPDGRMLWGGRAKFALSDPQQDLESARVLQRGMVEVHPQLANARIDYAWGGLVGITMDRIPHAGVQDGIHYAIGYNGHGVQMATYMGSVIGDIIDGRAEANPWRDQRFPLIPGHFGPPWFLPFADAYYKAKDALS